MLKIIGSYTFWSALGSIATFFVVFLTYKLLRYYRSTDRERTLRESAENIIQPLIRDLEKIIQGLKRLALSRSTFVGMGDVWHWPEIKKENSFLVYRLSKSIKEHIEAFHEALQKFINLYNQRIGPLEEVILKEIKTKLLEEVRKRTGRDSIGSGAKGTYYQLTIGGKRRQIFFQNLIFREQSPDEYIEEFKTDPTIPNVDIEDEKFVVDGVSINCMSKGKFEELASSILGKIKEDSKLQEFVVSSRKIFKKAQRLKQDLHQFSSKLIE